MNRWTNAGGSIDGHIPIVWRVPYKRVYPRLKTGDALNASIPMHGEGCMPRCGAENESASACEEWVNWMNVSTAWLWYVSFECERRTYRRSLSWMRLRANWCMESPGSLTPPWRNCRSFRDHVRRLWAIPQTIRRRAKKDIALPPSGKNCQEGKGWPFPVLRTGGHELAPEWTRGLACGHEEKEEKKRTK